MLGAAFVITISFAIVTLGWHFPSDVVGGFLLATFWALVIAAALRYANERWPERAGRTRVTAALQRAADGATTLGIAALAVLLVAGRGVRGRRRSSSTRPSDLVDFADEHTALVAVGGGAGPRGRRAARRRDRRPAALLSRKPDMLPAIGRWSREVRCNAGAVPPL